MGVLGGLRAGLRGGPRLRARAHEPGSRRRVAAWPLSQVLWCASTLNALAAASGAKNPGDPGRHTIDVDAWWLALQWYRSGQGYVDHRPRGQRYYDDNAWLGLVAAQQALLTGAERWWARAGQVARFVAEGTTESGAVCWVEGGDTLNACSTGSAAVLFDALARQAPGLPPADRARFAAQAHAARAFLQGPLLRSDGLVADHVRPDGTVEPSVWAYNQALLLHVESRRGEDEAAATVAAAVEHGMPAPVMARQPAVFACIWWRALLAHRAREGATRVPEVAQYLQLAWDRGRDARGLFRGVTRYDAGVVLDHVSLTGLMAAYAAGPSAWESLL